MPTLGGYIDRRLKRSIKVHLHQLALSVKTRRVVNCDYLCPSTLNNFVRSEGGGAVWISAGSTTTFTNSSFTGNTLFLNNTEGGGGAIFNNGGDLTINGGLFERVADAASFNISNDCNGQIA